MVNFFCFRSLTTRHASNSTASFTSVWQSILLEYSMSQQPFGQTMQSKYSQYRRMQQEWRNTVYLARSKIQVRSFTTFFFCFIYCFYFQGLGLYAARDIEMNTMIIEYLGEVIRNEMAEKREKVYHKKGKREYMFRIDPDR